MFLASFACVRLLALLLFFQSQESTSESFKELGSLLLWGMLGAVGVSIIVVVIWLKIKSRRDDSASRYVSINPARHENQS